MCAPPNFLRSFITPSSFLPNLIHSLFYNFLSVYFMSDAGVSVINDSEMFFASPGFVVLKSYNLSGFLFAFKSLFVFFSLISISFYVYINYFYVYIRLLSCELHIHTLIFLYFFSYFITIFGLLYGQIFSIQTFSTLRS
jgi:hypothetical protein